MKTEKRVDEIQVSITKVLPCRVSVEVENGRCGRWVSVCRSQLGCGLFCMSVTFRVILVESHVVE